MAHPAALPALVVALSSLISSAHKHADMTPTVIMALEEWGRAHGAPAQPIRP
jgi:hypothetical protein